MKNKDKKQKVIIIGELKPDAKKLAEQCFLHSVSNSFCNLYKKQCIGSLCSVTPNPEKCKHLKQNDCQRLAKHIAFIFKIFIFD